MAWFRGTGRARPSKEMSWLTAAVGIGMVVSVASFFVSPLLGGGLFVILWVMVVVGIVAYHIRNATSRDGVHHTQFDFRAESGGRASPADRLRQLEDLRKEGLVTEEEYRRKRADILGEDW